jgi:hypothetical protein
MWKCRLTRNKKQKLFTPCSNLDVAAVVSNLDWLHDDLGSPIVLAAAELQSFLSPWSNYFWKGQKVSWKIEKANIVIFV